MPPADWLMPMKAEKEPADLGVMASALKNLLHIEA